MTTKQTEQLVTYNDAGQAFVNGQRKPDLDLNAKFNLTDFILPVAAASGAVKFLKGLAPAIFNKLKPDLAKLLSRTWSEAQANRTIIMEELAQTVAKLKQPGFVSGFEEAKAILPKQLNEFISNLYGLEKLPVGKAPAIPSATPPKSLTGKVLTGAEVTGALAVTSGAAAGLLVPSAEPEKPVTTPERDLTELEQVAEFQPNKTEIAAFIKTLNTPTFKAMSGNAEYTTEQLETLIADHFLKGSDLPPAIAIELNDYMAKNPAAQFTTEPVTPLAQLLQSIKSSGIFAGYKLTENASSKVIELDAPRFQQWLSTQKPEAIQALLSLPVSRLPDQLNPALNPGIWLALQDFAKSGDAASLDYESLKTIQFEAANKNPEGIMRFGITKQQRDVMKHNWDSFVYDSVLGYKGGILTEAYNKSGVKLPDPPKDLTIGNLDDGVSLRNAFARVYGSRIFDPELNDYFKPGGFLDKEAAILKANAIRGWQANPQWAHPDKIYEFSNRAIPIPPELLQLLKFPGMTDDETKKALVYMQSNPEIYDPATQRLVFTNIYMAGKTPYYGTIYDRLLKLDVSPVEIVNRMNQKTQMGESFDSAINSVMRELNMGDLVYTPLDILQALKKPQTVRDLLTKSFGEAAMSDPQNKIETIVAAVQQRAKEQYNALAETGNYPTEAALNLAASRQLLRTDISAFKSLAVPHTEGRTGYNFLGQLGLPQDQIQSLLTQNANIDREILARSTEGKSPDQLRKESEITVPGQGLEVALVSTEGSARKFLAQLYGTESVTNERYADWAFKATETLTSWAKARMQENVTQAQIPVGLLRPPPGLDISTFKQPGSAFLSKMGMKPNVAYPEPTKYPTIKETLRTVFGDLVDSPEFASKLPELERLSEAELKEQSVKTGKPVEELIKSGLPIPAYALSSLPKPRERQPMEFDQSELTPFINTFRPEQLTQPKAPSPDDYKRLIDFAAKSGYSKDDLDMILTEQFMSRFTPNAPLIQVALAKQGKTVKDFLDQVMSQQLMTPDFNQAAEQVASKMVLGVQPFSYRAGVQMAAHQAQQDYTTQVKLGQTYQPGAFGRQRAVEVSQKYQNMGELTPELQAQFQQELAEAEEADRVKIPGPTVLQQPSTVFNPTRRRR